MYVFTHNMPGYMPESDPEFYVTFAEAKASAIDWLVREGDYYAQSADQEDQDNADTLSAEMEDLNLNNGPEWSTVVGNVAYSISQVDAHEVNENILTDGADHVVAYAWPGGYRVWYITHDGAELCAECVQAELGQCVDASYRNGWYVVGYMSEADSDDSGPCDNCGRRAESGE